MKHQFFHTHMYQHKSIFLFTRTFCSLIMVNQIKPRDVQDVIQLFYLELNMSYIICIQYQAPRRKHCEPQETWIIFTAGWKRVPKIHLLSSLVLRLKYQSNGCTMSTRIDMLNTMNSTQKLVLKVNNKRTFSNIFFSSCGPAREITKLQNR